MTAPLTAEEATELLRKNPRSYTTPEQLRALAAQVDADSSGRLTVLYSGATAKGVWSSDVIKSMVEAGEDVRTIDTSQAARFLKSRDFYAALAKSYGLPDFRTLVDGTYRGPASDWLYHPTEGPWADASARFADKTVGEVRAIVSDAHPSRVFGAIEVPHILANQNVTAVEGIPREVLVARQSTHGTQAAFEMVVARARDNVGQLQVAVNYAGTTLRGDDGVIPMDGRGYFVGTQIAGGTPPSTAVTRQLADTMNPPTEYVLAGQRHFDDWQAQAAQTERAAEAARAAPSRRMGTAVGLGVAASAYDAVQTGSRVSNLLAQDNPLAAQSALTHYAARGAGGWVGGAVTGFAVGWETGFGAVGFVAVGAVAGSQVGENVAKWWDNKQIYEQEDEQGVEWEFNGRQWLRQERADLSDDGVDAPTKQSFSALPAKARELDFMASNVATALALGNVEPPRDPYDLPADATDPESLGDANWKRNADTGDWQRETIVARTDRGHPLTRTDTASPERAAQLERDAEQVIQANIASGPAPIAARYQLAYKANGWQSFGAEPSAVAAALASGDRLTASDQQTYRRDQDGQWRTDGGETAQGNTARELDGMRERLQPALAQHAEQLAAMPAWKPPLRDELDRINLRSAYEAVGVAPSQDRFDAALEAIQRTREAQHIDPNLTSLYVERNEKGGYDTHSPIVHLARDARGVHVAAVTSAQEIELALLDLRGMNHPPAAEAPERRIAALSPQQRDAQEQMIREANRQGVSNDQVQHVAAVAAATPVRVEGAEPVREAEALRVMAEPEPASVSKMAEPPVPSPPQSPAAAAEVAAPELKAPETKADQSPPLIEPKKPDVTGAQPTIPDPPAPPPAPVPDAPAEAPATPAPPVSQPTAASAPSDDTLRRGDRGQDVELLQYRLHRTGYRDADGAPLPQNGHYDAATEQAVRQFQRDRGLADTGVADASTQQAMSAAQHARIESQKSARQDASTAPPERAPVADEAPPPVEPAPSRTHAYAPESEARAAPSDHARDQPSATTVRSTTQQSPEPVSTERATTVAAFSARAGPEAEAARLSTNDQAMYAKIRAGAPDNISDDHVAALMLAAKRNGVPSADEIRLVAVAGDKLWLDRTTPGFHTGVALDEPAPAMRDTVRDTQTFNQQRDQQVARDAAQRGQDEPSRGPKV